MPNDEDTLAHPEQPRLLLTPWLWAVALFVFFGLIVLIAFGAMPRGSTYEEDRARARVEKFKTAQEEWRKAEETYGWADQAKGVVHMPIERAMALELDELKSKQVMAAGPIAPPATENAPATATQPSPSPATAASPAPNEEPQKNQGTGPAAAAHPPNAAPGTQPGPAATPAAKPKSASEVPPVRSNATPVQHAPGTPIPVRGASATPSPTAP